MPPVMLHGHICCQDQSVKEIDAKSWHAVCRFDFFLLFLSFLDRSQSIHLSSSLLCMIRKSITLDICPYDFSAIASTEKCRGCPKPPRDAFEKC